MSTEQMSPYELRAWNEAIERLNQRKTSRVRQAVGAATAPLKGAAANVWQAMPGHDEIEQQVFKALLGLKTLTFDPALRSVDATKTFRRHGVETGAGLLAFDLAELDRGLPITRTLYVGTAAAEGGGSALAVTGAEVSSTVTGGVTVGVAAAAIAADVATSMALMGRVIGRVAAEYGYDVRLPEEEAFALGVLSLGTASTAGEKAAALASLRRLTAQMMRQATWAELNEHALVKLIQKVYAALGEKLTKRKLGQAVPIAGVFINSGLSAYMVDSTYRAARDVYRLRFLSDKYGIDPSSWVGTAEAAGPDGAPDVLAEALDELGTSADEAYLGGATRDAHVAHGDD